MGRREKRQVTKTSFMELFNSFEAELRALGIDTPQKEKLATYLDLLRRHNREINLVSRKLTPEALVTDHLLDSLAALPHLPTSQVTADLGSGGGFPAVPLAVCRPQTRFLLFEKSPLKCRFLHELVSLCPNLEIRGRWEKGEPGDGMDLVVARAFKPLPVILELTRAYFRRGGRYLLYKGRRAVIEDEIKNAGLPRRAACIRELDPVGEIEERHLVLIHVFEGNLQKKMNTRAHFC